MNAEQHMATNNFRTVEQMSEIYAELEKLFRSVFRSIKQEEFLINRYFDD